MSGVIILSSYVFIFKLHCKSINSSLRPSLNFSHLGKMAHVKVKIVFEICKICIVGPRLFVFAINRAHSFKNLYVSKGIRNGF